MPDDDEEVVEVLLLTRLVLPLVRALEPEVRLPPDEVLRTVPDEVPEVLPEVETAVERPELEEVVLLPPLTLVPLVDAGAAAVPEVRRPPSERVVEVVEPEFLGVCVVRPP